MRDAKRVLEEAIDTWNAGDREAWAALYDENVEWEAPGGARISGLEDLKVKYFDALLEAAPDRASSVDSLVAEGDVVAEEGRYTGTHTGTWRSPDGVEIPATGKSARLSFQCALPCRERQDHLDSPLLRPTRGAHSAWSDASSRSGLTPGTYAPPLFASDPRDRLTTADIRLDQREVGDGLLRVAGASLRACGR